MIVRALLGLALTLALPTSDREDAIPYGGTARPVHGTGEVLVHDNGAALYAFGRVGARWTEVAQTGSTVLGIAARTVLVATPGGDHVAYSAPLDRAATAPIDPGWTVLGTHVEDDLALVWTEEPTATVQRFWAYSSRKDTWSAQDCGIAAYRTSSAVALVRDGTIVHGFSALMGTWTSFLAGTPSAGFAAGGNVAVSDYVDAGGTSRTAAFSALSGSFAASPSMHATSTTRVSRDLAYIRGHEDAATFRAAAFSAVTGSWTSSANVHLTAGITESLSAETVLVVDAGTAPFVEAIGAHPAAGFATLAGAVELLVQAGACLVVRDAGGCTLYGFSGTSTGTFQSAACAGTVSAHALQGDGATLALLREDSGVVHAFSAPRSEWASTLGAAAFVSFVGPSFAVCRSQSAQGWTLHGISARHGGWVLGPTTSQAIGFWPGYLIHDLTGSGSILVFSERSNRFLTAGSPAPLSGVAWSHSPAVFDNSFPSSAPHVVHLYRHASEEASRLEHMPDWSVFDGSGPPWGADAGVVGYVDTGGRLRAVSAKSSHRGATGETPAPRDWP